MMAQIREDSRARKAKENLTERNEGRNESRRKRKQSGNWIKTCDIIKKFRIHYPNHIIEKVYRRSNKRQGRFSV